MFLENYKWGNAMVACSADFNAISSLYSMSQ